MSGIVEGTAALAVACNILNVVDWSLKLILESYEIGKSAKGDLPSNETIEKCTTELFQRNLRLQQSIDSSTIGGEVVLDEDDAALETLGGECNFLARRLIERLRDLQRIHGSSSIFRNARQALKAGAAKDEVESIAARMKDFQDQIDSRMLQSINLRQKLIALDQNARLDDLDYGEKQILEAVKSNGLRFTDQLNAMTDLMLRLFQAQESKTADKSSKTQIPDDKLSDTSYVDVQNAHSQIHQYVCQGKRRDVQALIRREPQAVRAIDHDGRTPLHYAALTGDIAIAETLVRRGADVNADDDDMVVPLHLAAQSASVSCVRFLCEKGADPFSKEMSRRTPLDMTANAEVAWILAHGHKLDARNEARETALTHFTSLGDVKTVKSLLDQGAGQSTKTTNDHPLYIPFARAAGYKPDGHPELMEMLLQAGANQIIDCEDEERRDTALQYACFQGRNLAVKKLIEWGADLNCHVQRRGRDGATPLTIAAHRGHYEYAKILIQHKADVNVQTNKQETPLFLASRGGSASIVTLLLENGAAVNATDKDGWTSLMATAHKGHADCAKLLLKHNADMDIILETPLHVSPLTMAAHMGHLEIVDLFLEYGANRNDGPNGIGLTPLLEAISNNQTAIITRLLEIGVNANTEMVRQQFQAGEPADDEKCQKTPLCYATWKGEEEIVILLIKHGADVCTSNLHGRTALHLAAERGLVEATRLLLQEGAQKDVLDNNKETPLDSTLRIGPPNWPKIVSILKSG